MAKYVLVIDPVSTNRIRLLALLEDAQYDVVSAPSVAEVSALHCEPDLIILGLSDKPAKTIASLATLQIAVDTPLLCLDSDPSPLRRLLVLRAGARDVLPRAAPDTLIRARLRGLIREGEAERECERRRVTAASFGFAEATREFAADARIVCVGATDAVPGVAHLLASTLEHRLDTLRIEEVLREEADQSVPDAYIIVSGQNYRVLDGLLPELRDRSQSGHAPLLVLYPADRPDIATRALALGASDIAADNASGEELSIRVEEILKRKRERDALRRSDEQSYRLAATDPLTGLYNRRYAEAYLGDLMMRASENQSGFTLMIVDLDHFKAVNDQFGHTTGDRVLCEIAHRLRDNLRACDLVSRHGGEEFLVILPDTDPAEAAITAERLRSAISSAPIGAEHGEKITVTASIGVATGSVSMQEPVARVRNGTFDLAEPRTPLALSQVFDAADAALYAAKDSGRNRVEFSAS